MLHQVENQDSTQNEHHPDDLGSCYFFLKHKSAKKHNIDIKLGTVHSSDVFYKMNDNYKELYDKYNCLCVEMESFALFNQARLLKKEAACLLTISNSLVTGDSTTSEERQNKFLNMIEVALNTL